ncbi:DUF748 domain-containing protein [Pinirhizobacter soli]|uniref:DUF748 domain-containing protein n=1 Tax=Pinirhizobacter soli TaxID=2786953 RepID=UPI00202A151F|nr:DUF748 domain-containing protein [Pinirhizobacter soli]
MKARYSRPLWILGVLLVLVIAGRMALPYAVLHYLNGRMQTMGAYRGHIGDIDIHLWRGAYTINGLVIEKVDGNVPVHFLNAPHTDTAISWKALRHGVVRAKVDFYNAELNFVDGRGGGESQTGKGVDWREQIKHLAPIRLDEINVHDSTVTFRNFVSSPRVDLKATDVNGTLANLSNASRANGTVVATADIKANILGDAPLTMKASFDPLQNLGDFKYELVVKDIVLTKANDLIRAYAGLDFAAGKGDFVMELESNDRKLSGYAKPLFHDVQIFSWKQDVEQDHKNPLQIAWEATAQGLSWIFKNHDKDQLATRVAISGRLDQKNVSTWDAITGILRNAFVKAYSPTLEKLKPDPEKK